MLLNHAFRLASFAILSGLLCPAPASAASDHARTKTEKKQFRGFSLLETKKKKKKKARKKEQMNEEARAIHQTLTNTRFPAIKMEDVPFKEVLDFARHLLQRKGSMINIIPMLGSADSSLYRQKMSQRVSLALQDASVADILTLACVQAGLEYSIINQGVTISIPKDGVAGCSIPIDETKAKEDAARCEAIHQALENTSIPTLDMEFVPLKDFLDYMKATLRRKGNEVNFIALSGSTKGKQISDIMSHTVDLHLKNVSVDDVLTLVSMQLGLQYAIIPQGVTIGISKDGSTGSAIPVDETKAKEDAARREAIHKTLVDTRIPSLDIENMPLGDFLEFVKATLRRYGSDINFIALAGSTNGKQYSDMMSQRVTLKLNDVSVDDVLTLVGMQLGIKHTIMPQGVAIGSAEGTP